MRAPRSIEHRIFIVGVPRSGTTLVQSLLAAHSTMTSFTESHFFDRHFTQPRPFAQPILIRDPEPRLSEFLSENGEDISDAAAWLETKGRRPLRAKFFMPLQTRRVARRLLQILDELALRRDATGWVEKTPRHLRYIPFLEGISDPGLRTSFVHVIRKGLEVVASLHRASQSWERPYDLDTCVNRWNADVGFSLSRVTSANDHFVFYEELTARPKATLERLLGGIGLGWEPKILERYPTTSGQIVTSDETWKADIGRSIRRSGSSDRVLTGEERDHVSTMLDHPLYDQLFAHVGQRSGATGEAD